VRTPRPWFDPPDATERAILDLIARGRTHAEIGAALHLSEGAVSTRLTFLRRLWRVASAPQLFVLAGQCRWARVPDRERQRPVLRSVGVPRIKGRMTARERHPWKDAA
jgi:DNA-binding CsgD family transcriptional regulator